MIILYWMTPDPAVASEDQSLLCAFEEMRKKKVRRLPVVRGEDLVGIIGRADLHRWVPPGELGGDLSVDGRAALERARVADAMTRDPHTCDAYDHVEHVSEKMRQTKVGAFPVLNRGHLVGIISEVDLLGALAELSHYGEGGKRITLQIPIDQKIDMLYNIVDLARRSGLELLAVLTHPILDESANMATLNVDVDIPNNQAFTITNGLTLNGALRLLGIGNSTILDFAGTQLLSGTGSIEFAGYVRNLLNEPYKTFAFDASTFQGTTIYFNGDPRTYGGSLSVRF